jgi:NAD(P)-dependent dehydrogenase (short-subunit alcohol dehydrogenase family)
MRQQGSGAIVHVVARPGSSRPAAWGAYSVSKAALVHLTRILDIKLRPQGIRVNAVAPQLLDTPRNRAMFPAGWAPYRDPAELVDELHLTIFPVIAGGGIPLFTGHPPVSLKLLSARTWADLGSILTICQLILREPMPEE